MLSCTKLQPKPRLFHNLCGLSLSEFHKLLPSFEQAWLECLEREHINRPGRKRQYGGVVRQSSKTIETNCCSSCSTFGTASLIGLGKQQQLPERRPHKFQEVLAACPELEFVIDGSERLINCPQDKEKREKHTAARRNARR